MTTRELPIRTCTVIDGDGKREVAASTFCPHQDRSAPLVECETCVKLRGMHFAEGGGSSLWCQVPPERHAAATPIHEVMTRDVVCVRPDLPLFALAALLLERGVGGAPVVDGDGRPIGVISKTDVVRARCERDDDEVVTVAEVMMPIAFTLEETSPVEQAAALMALERVHRVPVVDADGRVVGILTALDVTRWVARRAGY
jgi:CBS domain-containing protein